jgi:glutamine phosphoribosylpyrophosphate amidotransferase
MCGIAGAIGVDNATDVIRTMLHALQNRGQQAAGIVSIDGTIKHEYRSKGTVIEFPQEELDALVGNIASGCSR